MDAEPTLTAEEERKIKGVHAIWQATLAVQRMPRTDDQLHMYIKGLCGFHVPRVAPTEGQRAPFDFVADAFFGRFERALVWASRGGGKTQDVAILNLLASKFHPMTHTAHFGAVGRQAAWGFEYLQNLAARPWFIGDIVRSVGSVIQWRNGSWVMPLSGHTPTGVTAIRANRLVQDEIDLWNMAIFETSQMMVQGTEQNPAQRIFISTQYTAYGLMSQLLREAPRRGYAVYKWDVWACCSPDTLVETDTGRVRIDQLKAGDKVWSFDGNRFRLVPLGKVGCTHRDTHLLAIDFSNGETLKATPDHKVLTPGGWVEMRDLMVGAAVLTNHTKSLTIPVIHSISLEVLNEDLSGLWGGVHARVFPDCAVQGLSPEGIHLPLWAAQEDRHPFLSRVLGGVSQSVCGLRSGVQSQADQGEVVSDLSGEPMCLPGVRWPQEAAGETMSGLFHKMAKQGVPCQAGGHRGAVRGPIEEVQGECGAEGQESKRGDAAEDECSTERTYCSRGWGGCAIRGRASAAQRSRLPQSVGRRDAQDSARQKPIEYRANCGSMAHRDGYGVGEGKAAGCVQSRHMVAVPASGHRGDERVLAQPGSADGAGCSEEGSVDAGRDTAVGVVGRSDTQWGGAADSFRLASVVAIRDGGRSDVWDCYVPGTHNFVANSVVVHNSIQRCKECQGKECPLFIWVNPRTGQVEPLCRGRALLADGYVPLQAAVDEYLATDPVDYQVQKLLEEPEREYLVLPTFDERFHVGVAPEEAFGDTAVRTCGVDPGFDHPLVFVVLSELPNGDVWGIHEHGERFASPSREAEIAGELDDEFGPLTFYVGHAGPETVANLAELGLTVVSCPVKRRDARHRAVRTLLARDPVTGSRLKFDKDRVPVTIWQMATVHRDPRTGAEVAEGNDYFDAAEAALVVIAAGGSGGAFIR